MILIIDTSQISSVEVKIKKDEREEVIENKDEAEFKQAEKLLPLVSRTLEKANLELKDITEIRVVVTGETFTGLRIGVVTANALGYGLNVPVWAIDASGDKNKEQTLKQDGFYIVSPKYKKPPNITIK